MRQFVHEFWMEISGPSDGQEAQSRRSYHQTISRFVVSDRGFWAFDHDELIVECVDGSIDPVDVVARFRQACAAVNERSAQGRPEPADFAFEEWQALEIVSRDAARRAAAGMVERQRSILGDWADVAPDDRQVLARIARSAIARMARRLKPSRWTPRWRRR
jgi:hypothetical protein